MLRILLIINGKLLAPAMMRRENSISRPVPPYSSHHPASFPFAILFPCQFSHRLSCKFHCDGLNFNVSTFSHLPQHEELPQYQDHETRTHRWQ